MARCRVSNDSRIFKSETDFGDFLYLVAQFLKLCYRYFIFTLTCLSSVSAKL